MLTITSDRTKGSTERSDADNDREQLRKEAETLVQATEEARRDLLVQTEESLQQDQTPQGDPDAEMPKPGAANETSEEQAPPNQQLQKWDKSGEDTARWLYRWVFQESQLLDSRASSSSAVVLVDPAAKSRVLDGLLHAWTTLVDEEIKHSDKSTAENPRPAAPERGRPTSKAPGFTLLSRRSVSPAALDLGKEKYMHQEYAGGVSVIGVHRNMRQEEIDAYKEATATLRGRREDRIAAEKRKEPRHINRDTTSERDVGNADAASSPWSGATKPQMMIKAMWEAGLGLDLD